MKNDENEENEENEKNEGNEVSEGNEENGENEENSEDHGHPNSRPDLHSSQPVLLTQVDSGKRHQRYSTAGKTFKEKVW